MGLVAKAQSFHKPATGKMLAQSGRMDRSHKKDDKVMTTALRLDAGNKWGRLATAALLFFPLVMLLMPSLAFAQQGGGFTEFESKVKTNTTEATRVAQSILWAAAVLALLVGIAPMLWGQIKVKWIVSCLVAATLFGLVGSAITAFRS